MVLCTGTLVVSSSERGSADSPPLQEGPPRIERLTYTISFLGVAVARAMIEVVQTDATGGEWLVRGAGRTTAFWDKFSYMHNSYVTRFKAPGFNPSVFERNVDQKGLRFDRVEWYGREGEGGIDTGGLPPLPEAYGPVAGAVEAEVISVPAGHGNFFSALWYIRNADWERTLEVTLPLWLEGQSWQVTVKRVGVGTRRMPEGRVEAWELICTFSKNRDAAGSVIGAESVPATDHITYHLMNENAELTFWIERAPSRRPIAVSAAAGVFRVTAHLREPFEEERLPPGY